MISEIRMHHDRWLNETDIFPGPVSESSIAVEIPFLNSNSPPWKKFTKVKVSLFIVSVTLSGFSKSIQL